MAKRVLIVVDMQNDFADPHGALYVPGGEKLIGPITSLVMSELYDRVFHTADCHPENHYSFRENGGRWPRHCVEDTWGVKFVIPANANGVIVKGADPEDRNDYSGFSGWNPWLRAFPENPRLGIKEIIKLQDWAKDDVVVDVVGLALDYCVKATALDSVKSFKTRVLLPFTRAVNINPDDGTKAIIELREIGVEIVE